VQCSAVRCSVVQCSAVQCSVVQCSAVQCSVVQCSAVQCSVVQGKVLNRAGDEKDEHVGHHSIQFNQISLHAIQSMQLDTKYHNMR
jgi:hypothetical protein